MTYQPWRAGRKQLFQERGSVRDTSARREPAGRPTERAETPETWALRKTVPEAE